ncbi:MAG: PepSY domain-containing protein [Fimbriimonadaceae bacterium]|nr:PepSY domain-containing protein [Alphaproteobacteria bacterium]
MKKFLVLAASSMTLAIATPALASGDGVNCGDVTGQMMSQEEAKVKARELGYDVRRVKSEGGCFEVYAIDQNGARVEIYMNPVTGAIVKTKNDS